MFKAFPTIDASAQITNHEGEKWIQNKLIKFKILMRNNCQLYREEQV